ncbi:MAG: hypothetical protein ACOCUE_01975 [Candidatus Izemoplasmataceae bacterium]
MKKLNHYQKDIAFLVLLIVLQVVFSGYNPFRLPEAASSVNISSDFLLIRFDFIDIGQTQTYFPYLTLIYAALLIYLMLQKQRRFALIYGFAVVLVAKLYYLNELYSINGTYTTIEKRGYFLKQIIIDGEIVAQDVTLSLLLILTGIKIMIYIHDFYIVNKKVKEPIKKHFPKELP